LPLLSRSDHLDLDLVQQIKGASSHLMSHEVTPQRGFKWQGAYGAFTVGQDGLAAVKAYVLNQKQYHSSQDLWEDWERTWLPEGEAAG
jgi:putative transposase